MVSEEREAPSRQPPCYSPALHTFPDLQSSVVDKTLASNLASHNTCKEHIGLSPVSQRAARCWYMTTSHEEFTVSDSPAPPPGTTESGTKWFI